MREIERQDLLGMVRQIKDEGFSYLSKITAVDYPDRIEVIYLLTDLENKRDEIIRVRLQANDLWVPTLLSVFKGADWHERELSEMFGIEIKGRRAPRLLLDKWDGVDPPLRKTFKWGEKYRSAD